MPKLTVGRERTGNQGMDEKEDLDGTVEFRFFEEGGDPRQGVRSVFVLSGDRLFDVPGLVGLENSPMILSGSSEPSGGEDRATVRFGDSPQNFYDAVKPR